MLPRTADSYAAFASAMIEANGDDPAEEEPWAPVYLALYQDLSAGADVSAWDGPAAALLSEASEIVPGFETLPIRDMVAELDKGWLTHEVWATIKSYATPYTAGYFASSVDLQITEDGVEPRPGGRAHLPHALQADTSRSSSGRCSCRWSSPVPVSCSATRSPTCWPTCRCGPRTS